MGISTTGPTIGPFKEGDQMYGAMTRTNSYTWKIDTVINGQTSTLNARVGSYRYTWAVATFEDYGVSECSQLPQKAVIFDTVKLYDDSNAIATHNGIHLVAPCAVVKPPSWMRTPFQSSMAMLQLHHRPLIHQLRPSCKKASRIIFIQNDDVYTLPSEGI